MSLGKTFFSEGKILTFLVSIRKQRVADLDAWAKEGKLTPYFSHAFPLEQAKDALLAKWNREITGGCVVNPPIADWGAFVV